MSLCGVITSEEWKQKYILAQQKIDSLLEKIELKSADNDTDAIELLDDRLEKAMKYRDDCADKYYEALACENDNGNGSMILSLPRSDYGY